MGPAPQLERQRADSHWERHVPLRSPEWVPEHFRRKWRWAARVANTKMTEWVYRVTDWRSSEWQTAVADWGMLRPRRPSRRRWMRFEDSLRQFCRDQGLGDWQRQAGDATAWQSLTADFVGWAATAQFDD